MLTENQIQDNKQRFISLVNSINIEGARLTELIAYLDQQGFFISPASTQYNCAFVGGLCQHCLNVYDNLLKLYDLYSEELSAPIPPESLIICGLLHKVGLAGFYEEYNKNEKLYSENGRKHDNGGNFDWVVVTAYKIKDAKDRYVLGTNEENTVMQLQRYIALSDDEIAAILNYKGISDPANPNYDSYEISRRYSLQTLLHTASFIATNITDKKYE